MSLYTYAWNTHDFDKELPLLQKLFYTYHSRTSFNISTLNDNLYPYDDEKFMLEFDTWVNDNKHLRDKDYSDIQYHINHDSTWVRKYPMLNKSVSSIIYFLTLPLLSSWCFYIKITDTFVPETIYKKIDKVYPLEVITTDDCQILFPNNTGMTYPGIIILGKTKEIILDKIWEYYFKSKKISLEDFREELSIEIKDLTSFVSKINSYKKDRVIRDLNIEKETYMKALARLRKAMVKATNLIEEVDKKSATVAEGLDVDNFVKVLKLYESKKYIKIFKHPNDKNILVLTVTTPLFNFNELAVEKLLNKSTRPNKIKTILKNTFLSDKYSFMVETDIGVDVVNNYAFRHSPGGVGSHCYDNDCMYKNPHIWFYNCFGSNGEAMSKLLKECKYEEFMAALIATVGNINFNDSVVVERFLDNIANEVDNNAARKSKTIKDNETGEMLTFKELLGRVGE